MAFPTVLINSATGSDSAASGAGPATALTGTAAATDATGLIVTLDGTPDLSGVATDGSAVIYLQDSTAGARNFGRITSLVDAADTVTVDTAFRTSASGLTWAIGGKRATMAGTNSAKLYSNNSAAGDALSGWTIQMESGHTETIAGNQNLRRNVDTTNGALTLEGVPGAATLPALTFTNNGIAITVSGQGWLVRNLNLINTNATKTASVGIQTSGANCRMENIQINQATNRFWKGLVNGAANTVIYGCRVVDCANCGIEIGNSGRVENCLILSNDVSGISYGGTTANAAIENNVIAYNTGDGITVSSASASVGAPTSISGNTLHGNSDNGIEFSAAASNLRVYAGLKVQNNILSFNGAYGINFTGASVTAATLAGHQSVFRGNLYFSNTTGKFLPTDVSSILESTTDPSGGLASSTTDYTGATGGTDFEVVAAVKAQGYPGTTFPNGTTGSTISYVDPGAAQREEPAAGGGSTPHIIGG